MRENFHTEVIHINNRTYDISSTQIRERIQDGTTARELLPEAVERYIRENGLYAGGSLDCEHWKTVIEPFLKEHLKSKRLNHTYGVAKTAKELAIRYGEDPEKAELAGLCHDMMRNISPEESAELRQTVRTAGKTGGQSEPGSRQDRCKCPGGCLRYAGC